MEKLNILTIAILFAMGALTASCPTITNRQGWGARPPTAVEVMKSPVPYVIVHHTVMGEGECNTTEQCIKVMHDIQDLHMDVNEWADVGYSFLVGGDGAIYEGRGWNKVGAHAPNYNDKSIGISLIGNFMEHLPSELQLNVTQSLISCAVEEGYVVQNYTLYGHRDVRATECPGDQLFQEISNWPQFHYGDNKTSNTDY